MPNSLNEKIAAQRTKEAIKASEKAISRTQHRLQNLLDILVERGVISADDRATVERIVA